MQALEPSAPGATQARLTELGITLPTPLAPNASYVPVIRQSELLFVSGQLPFSDSGELVARGLLGGDVDLQLGVRCAERCAINLLSHLAAACDLDRVRLLKVQVFVASTVDFDSQHLVANGASDLLARVLGARGEHARSAFGVASLPFSAPVEVEAIAAELLG